MTTFRERAVSSAKCMLYQFLVPRFLLPTISERGVGFFFYTVLSCRSLLTFTLIKMYITRIISFIAQLTYEPPRGKTNNVVSEQVRCIPACTVIEAG